MGAICGKHSSHTDDDDGKNILTVMKKEVLRAGFMTVNMNVICNMKCFLVMCTDRRGEMDYLRLSNGIVSWGSHPQSPVEFSKFLNLEVDETTHDVNSPKSDDHACYLFNMPQLYEHRHHLKVFSDGAKVSVACAILPEKIAKYVANTTKGDNVFSIRTCQITPSIKNRECGAFFTKLEGVDTTVNYVPLIRSAIVKKGTSDSNRVLVNESRQVLTRIDSPGEDLRGWFLENHLGETDEEFSEDLCRFLESGEFTGVSSLACESPVVICDDKRGLFISAESLESAAKEELGTISEFNRGFEWTTLSMEQGTPFKHADVVNMYTVDVKTNELKELCEMTQQGGSSVDELAGWLMDF